MTEFVWTPQRTKAAELMAQKSLTKIQIAKKVGVARITLYAWLDIPEFKARVDEAIAEIGAEVRRVGIADQTNRLAALDGLLRGHQELIRQRGKSKEMKGVPGGSTGLLVRDVKRVVAETDEDGETTTIEMDVYRYDQAPVREMRELMKQAAIEAGQWQEKVAVETTLSMVDSDETRRTLADPELRRLTLQAEKRRREIAQGT